MYIPKFVYYLPIKEHLGCFQFLVNITEISLNICVQDFKCISTLIGEMHRNMIAVLCSKTMFSFVRKWELSSKIPVPFYTPPKQLIRVSFDLQSRQQWVFSVFFFSDFSYSNVCSGISLFELLFSNDNHYIYLLCVYFLWWKVCSNFYIFFKLSWLLTCSIWVLYI